MLRRCLLGLGRAAITAANNLRLQTCELDYREGVGGIRGFRIHQLNNMLQVGAKAQGHRFTCINQCNHLQRCFRVACEAAKIADHHPAVDHGKIIFAEIVEQASVLVGGKERDAHFRRSGVILGLRIFSATAAEENNEEKSQEQRE